MIFYSTPLLIIVVVLYNILVFIPYGNEPATEETAQGAEVVMSGVEEPSQTLITKVIFDTELVSGAIWSFTVADMLAFLGVIILCIEIMKSVRTSTAAVINHSLSVLLFVGCILEFLLVKKAGTSVFFLITTYCLIDVVSGFTIGIVAARRDISMDKQYL